MNYNINSMMYWWWWWWHHHRWPGGAGVPRVSHLLRSGSASVCRGSRNTHTSNSVFMIGVCCVVLYSPTRWCSSALIETRCCLWRRTDETVIKRLYKVRQISQIICLHLWKVTFKQRRSLLTPYFNKHINMGRYPVDFPCSRGVWDWRTLIYVAGETQYWLMDGADS